MKPESKYFVVPGWEMAKDFQKQPHVVNRDGELVAVFEELDECIKFVEAMNKEAK